MAIDTRQKRQSVINLGSAWRDILPIPDGSFDEGDRQTFILLGAAELSGAPAAGYAFHGDLTTVFHFYLRALHDTAIVSTDSDVLVYEDVVNMLSGSTSTLNDRNSRYYEYLH